MRVGVVDVGSNTLRLLVADVPGVGGVTVVRERRAWARLGADIALTGEISLERLGAAANAVTDFVAEARRLSCAWLEVLIASPGRQAANAGDLVRMLERVTAAPVRVLGREEEARLGFLGAVGSAGPLDGAVAVCDVGGGSTQLAVGLADSGPAWMRSLDIGSLRLHAQAIEPNGTGKKAVATARDLVREQFSGLAAPLPSTALAIGGSARAVLRVAGRTLGTEELSETVEILRKRTPRDVSRAYDIPIDRARTLLAGALILAEIQHRLIVPLRVVTGGVREGAARELAMQRSAA
jgi:exopolyphosphatase / guanosine-5'-triphosphate,3'-diphosphate pyrophosphatase